MPATTPDALLLQIYIQRRIELWGEGFALNDIKRRDLGIDRNYAVGDMDVNSGTTTTVATNHRADARFEYPAQMWRFVFQIPLSEINSNPFITANDQNPGP